MNASRTLQILLSGIVLAATVATAAVVAGNLPAGGQTPSDPPGSPAPSGTPLPVPSDDPSDAPTDDPGDPMPIRVDIDNDTHHDVYVDIFDRSGRMVDARSGPAREGASVEPYKLLVENMDERTLRLTWVDYPIDNALALYIGADASGGLRLVLVQPEPTGDTDTIVSDRVLILEFEDEVSADDVLPFLQDGLDV